MVVGSVAQSLYSFYIDDSPEAVLVDVGIDCIYLLLEENLCNYDHTDDVEMTLKLCIPRLVSWRSVSVGVVCTSHSSNGIYL